MPPEPELTARLAAVIARTRGIPPELVTLEKSFADLNVDSLDANNILFALENEFDISIPEDAAKQIRSVREMAEGLEKLLAEKDRSQQGAAQRNP